MLGLRFEVLVFLVGLLAYLDNGALRGEFVYDDLGTVQKNPVARGGVYGRDVWDLARALMRNDFWGQSIDEPRSHKSWRPLTTLSFAVNWDVAEALGHVGTEDETLGFHCVNVVLHAVVSMLATVAVRLVLDACSSGGQACSRSSISLPPELVAGLLFALHPLHAESVSNVTGRAELLMALFYLMALISFARALAHTTSTAVSTLGSTKDTFFGLFVMPVLCTAASLLSKEHGVVALVSLVTFDFIASVGSFQQFMRGDTAVSGFCRRMTVLLGTTAILAWLRFTVNGESAPNFVVAQNPAAFANNLFTRVMSLNWVYCLYIWDMFCPTALSCDWSGDSIQLVESLSDSRVLAVVILWLGLAFSFAALVQPTKQEQVSFDNSISSSKKSRVKSESKNKNKHKDKDKDKDINTDTDNNVHRCVLNYRKAVLMAIFCFALTPFTLASNLFVSIGTMKADRLVYLPLLGWCVLEGLILDSVLKHWNENNKAKAMVVSLFLLQLAVLAFLAHERNIAWSNGARLWGAAFDINPHSVHTRYNAGYSLALDGQFVRAEEILRPLVFPSSNRQVRNDPNSVFVYVMVLKNLNRCKQALALVNDALATVALEGGDETSVQKPLVRNLRRTESNLMVAKGLCMEDDVSEMGKTLFRAIEIDPTNEYAVEQGQALLEKVEKYKQLHNMQQRGK